MTVLDAMITYDRSIDTREAFVQDAASFGSGDLTTMALRQAAVSLEKGSPQARSASSTRGSDKNNLRVMVA